jgi:hypothetical protein
LNATKDVLNELIDVLKLFTSVSKLFTLVWRFNTDILSDSTGIIKYLFIIWIAFKLRSSNGIVYIIILNNQIIIHMKQVNLNSKVI